MNELSFNHLRADHARLLVTRDLACEVAGPRRVPLEHLEGLAARDGVDVHDFVIRASRTALHGLVPHGVCPIRLVLADDAERQILSDHLHLTICPHPKGRGGE